MNCIPRHRHSQLGHIGCSIGCRLTPTIRMHSGHSDSGTQGTTEWRPTRLSVGGYAEALSSNLNRTFELSPSHLKEANSVVYLPYHCSSTVSLSKLRIYSKYHIPFDRPFSLSLSTPILRDQGLIIYTPLDTLWTCTSRKCVYTYCTLL